MPFNDISGVVSAGSGLGSNASAEDSGVVSVNTRDEHPLNIADNTAGMILAAQGGDITVQQVDPGLVAFANKTVAATMTVVQNQSDATRALEAQALFLNEKLAEQTQQGETNTFVSNVGSIAVKIALVIAGGFVLWAIFAPKKGESK